MASRSSATRSHALIPSPAANSTAVLCERRTPGPPAAPRRRVAGALDVGRAESGSVSSSKSSACVMRDVQPGPSSRRATTRSTSSRGPPRAPMRRSGPCDFEKLRTCSTRSGSQRGERHIRSRADRTRVVVLDHDRVLAVAAASQDHGEMLGPRAPIIETPVGLCARGCMQHDGGRRGRALPRTPRAACPRRRAGPRSARGRSARAGP